MFSRTLHYTMSQNMSNRQTDRETDTQDKYNNPRACALRVNNTVMEQTFPIINCPLEQLTLE